MITLNKFVGAFLQGLTTSRTISDRTSFKIADAYLKHDYLRGFPVPRMTFKQVELELKFSVAPLSPLELLLKEPEISKNLCHQIRLHVSEVPHSDAFKEIFGQNASFPPMWDKGIDDLVNNIQRILNGKIIDKGILIHALTLAIENFFYEIHKSKLDKGFLSGLRKIFTHSESEKGSNSFEQTATIRQWANKLVTDVLNSSLPEEINRIAELPDLNILVGAQDLEGQNPANLHSAKITFNSSDRKWVSSEENGKTKYLLDRS